LNGHLASEVDVRKVFVSYARVDRAQVDTLVEHLGFLGCQTWIDSSLQGGQQWWDEILTKIADCDVFLPVISRDALNSTACQREFDWAEALRKPVLPVAVERPSKALPSRLSMLQVIDYFDPAQRERNALSLAGALAALPAAPAPPQPMPTPPPAPLSYLTNLIELVSGRKHLDHEQQRQLLVQLESALRSVDPDERQGGLDILERFSSQENLYADVDRRLTWLKANTPSPSSSQPAAQPARQTRRRDTPSGSAQPPPTGSISTPTPKRRKAKLWLIAALAVVVVGGVAAYVMWPHPGPSRTQTTPAAGQTTQPAGGQTTPVAGQTAQPGAGQTAQPGAGQTAQPGAGQTQASRAGQTVLPFTAPIGVAGVAVDTTGNVFVAESGGSVLELPTGATASVSLPFTGVGQPKGIAVDSAGAVYITDWSLNTVWKLAANASSPAMVPFNGLKCGEHDSKLGNPSGIAVNTAGTVYVTDGACQGRVLTLAADSSTPTVLPFTGLVNFNGGVALDTSGAVYITDNYNNRVLKLAAGSNRPTPLPFTGLNNPQGVAVDSSGNLYVADSGNNRVLKLSAGSTAPTALPFTGLSSPQGVAVDSSGNVYVTDLGNSRVLKLAAG
jgi:sugar lactone lactonase YvrE